MFYTFRPRSEAITRKCVRVGVCVWVSVGVCDNVKTTNIHHCNVLWKVRPHTVLQLLQVLLPTVTSFTTFSSANLPTKHITSEDIIASGIDLLGFFASSPVVAIISNPMKA